MHRICVSEKIVEVSENFLIRTYQALRSRAQIEKLFWSVARDVRDMTRSMKHPPEELRKVARMLPEKYFCNFSLFQSLPDSWAIDQMFPIMPITRLDEKPTHDCTIQDVTCDSDGKISHFVSPQGTAYSLPVHELKGNEPYYLGVFLVGAYQEILMRASGNNASVSFQIGYSVKSGTVIVQELATLFGSDDTFLHGCGNPGFEIAHQFLGIILHIVSCGNSRRRAHRYRC